MNELTQVQKTDVEDIIILLNDMNYNNATTIEFERVVMWLEYIVKYGVRFDTSETLIGLGDMISKYKKQK